MKKLFFILGISGFLVGHCQVGFPVNGVADERSGSYAFINATVVQDPTTQYENGTLLIAEGRIVAVGQNVTIPSHAQVIDVQGKYIYPSLIDPYTQYGLPEVEASRTRGPKYSSDREQAYAWNEAINSDYESVSEFKVDSKESSKWRAAGFGSVVAFRPDGIVRGSSVVATLGDGPVQEEVLNPRASAHYSFSKGSSDQLYPTSIMGTVAMLRQIYLDSEWYGSTGNQEQTNMSLEAFRSLQSLPQVFEANGGKLRALLADRIGDEFGTQYVIKGNGDEYQRLAEIRATGASFIIPVNFPKAFDVEDPIDALEVSYSDLKHWELAPSNPGRLEEAGVPFVLTSAGLKDPKEFIAQVRKAIDNGLSETTALDAITRKPAQLIGMEQEIGTLRPGSRANFIITSDNLFARKVKIYENWVQGRPYRLERMDAPSLTGSYELDIEGTKYNLKISGADKPKGSIESDDTTQLDVRISVEDRMVQLSFMEKDASGPIRLSGWVSGSALKGTGRSADGAWISWSATPEDTDPEKDAPRSRSDAGTEETTGEVVYPFVAYGWSSRPTARDVLFKNATVWTMEEDGMIENADLLVRNGKIAAVGKNLEAGNARVVDATGKHITPGIIDEHSHAALSGVNESSHAIVSEVRMRDAIDSEDIDIYRQLAGGVTAAQLLHGSANPVGGQSAIIKFRWGLSPEALRIQGADEYIKFALGENVKQSNRSSQWVTRFPQTRMGVEQVYVDGFTRAREYDQAWDAYARLGKKQKAAAVPPRRDLQLEALAEILNAERFITCHSYVQSEINMLMKVAEQFDFRVNTFTHILEGYKVADKMAEHGVGGSTFSDWWAYKYEVKDAIPYNAALMTQAGVTVAINSDDSEMARRLNQEAAKTIRYGGVDEIEALKMVTINPARLLHLDDRMGSLKEGKDADVVMWSAHPLSVYARSEMTMVDGVVYYDLNEDRSQREAIQQERARIINKMKNAKKNGAPTVPYKPKERHVWDCEEFVDGNIVNK